MAMAEMARRSCPAPLRHADSVPRPAPRSAACCCCPRLPSRARNPSRDPPTRRPPPRRLRSRPRAGRPAACRPSCGSRAGERLGAAGAARAAVARRGAQRRSPGTASRLPSQRMATVRPAQWRYGFHAVQRGDHCGQLPLLRAVRGREGRVRARFGSCSSASDASMRSDPAGAIKPGQVGATASADAGVVRPVSAKKRFVCARDGRLNKE